MWWRNRKESWPPRGTRLESLRAFAHSSLQPPGVAPEYFSGHPSWLTGAQPDRMRRTRRPRD